MAPENIVREQNGKNEDLSKANLSKVDTFALGVILINMLTGAYLFESCLSNDYYRLLTHSDRMGAELRRSR